MNKIIIGSDHAGFRLKEAVVAHLRGQGIEVVDIGCPSEERVDYPGIAFELARRMKADGIARGVLCCGSGIGVSIAANRFPHVRAVVAHDPFTAEMSRRHNDANVLCMGGRFIAPAMAEEILRVWLNTAFEGGRHQDRVDMMTHVDSLIHQEKEISC